MSLANSRFFSVARTYVHVRWEVREALYYVLKATLNPSQLINDTWIEIFNVLEIVDVYLNITFIRTHLKTVSFIFDANI